MALESWGTEILRQGHLYNPGDYQLTDLIDSCGLYNQMLYCTCPVHNSVCYN